MAPTRDAFIAAWVATFPGDEETAARTYDALTRDGRVSPALLAWWADYVGADAGIAGGHTRPDPRKGGVR